MNFEITAVGFNAESDATDDRVLWVSAPTRLHLDWAMEGMPHAGYGELDPHTATDPQDFDFVLPGEERELQAVLREFAANPPTETP